MFPPYPCSGNEPYYDDIQILDAQGEVINIIVASECFANWYCGWAGYTWRHRPIDPPPAEE